MGTPLADFEPDRGGTGHLPRMLVATWIGLLAASASLVYLMASHGSPGDLADRSAAVTTAATVLGPFAGAVARHWQGCCVTFSMRLAAFACGPALAVGLLTAAVPLPKILAGRGGDALRVTLWSAGWAAWFLGGPASLLHALG